MASILILTAYVILVASRKLARQGKASRHVGAVLEITTNSLISSVFAVRGIMLASQAGGNQSEGEVSCLLLGNGGPKFQQCTGSAARRRPA